MRNKLFFSFLAVIFIAMISNLLYEKLITRDFEEYVNGAREDRLYWVMASVEGGYLDGSWDHSELHNAAHWAVMLGFDMKIMGADNREVINSEDVIKAVPQSMRKRMESIADLGSASGEYEIYPLFQKGRQIGTMLIRQLKRPAIEEKEIIFRQRGRYFLAITFLIAGGGALLLSFFFSIFLARPLRRMKKAVEAMAGGDFSIRVPVGSDDEIGRLAGSFNFMAEALQREDALRRHLTSNIAHELRTPLAVMKANIEAIQDGIITDSALGLESIRAENEKLIRLVEGIEDITKAEAVFFLQSRTVDLDLKEFANSLVMRMVPLAAEKGVGLSVMNRGSIKVMTDPDRLDSILQNLLANALRYTENGTVTVDFGKDSSRFFLEVSDTGVGIPDEIQKDIFRRFYRGEGSTGIGLGLSIVKELLDSMGGTIEIESSEGKGARFRIWLPVRSRQ